METLVLGRPGAERTQLIRALTDDGMSVHTCHDGAWGCAGLDDRCPLDARHVDAAVAFAAPGEALDPQGVACVQRARIPIVAVGGIEGDPLHALADIGVSRIDDSIAEVVTAAAVTANRHRRAVEEAAPGFLHEGEELSVDVRRDRDTLQATIGGRFAEDRIATIADQVRAAIRRFDDRAQVVDVSVDRAQVVDVSVDRDVLDSDV